MLVHARDRRVDRHHPVELARPRPTASAPRRAASPRCRPRPSARTACRSSSTSRTAPAHPARAPPCGTSRPCPRPRDDDPSTAATCRPAPASAAPEQPTPHPRSPDASHHRDSPILSLNLLINTPSGRPGIDDRDIQGFEVLDVARDNGQSVDCGRGGDQSVALRPRIRGCAIAPLGARQIHRPGGCARRTHPADLPRARSASDSPGHGLVVPIL